MQNNRFCNTLTDRELNNGCALEKYLHLYFLPTRMSPIIMTMQLICFHQLFLCSLQASSATYCMLCNFCLPLGKAVAEKRLWEITTYMLPDITQAERLEGSEMVGCNSAGIVMTSLSYIQEARLQCRLPSTWSVCFFNSGVKYLQNLLNIQNISIKFVSIIGVDVYL